MPPRETQAPFALAGGLGGEEWAARWAHILSLVPRAGLLLGGPGTRPGPEFGTLSPFPTQSRVNTSFKTGRW